MAVTLGALRALGTRSVTLRTAYGDFAGHVAQADIADSAIVVLFAVEGQSGEPLVVPVESIDRIEQR